jgi:hypothetical protein
MQDLKNKKKENEVLVRKIDELNKKILDKERLYEDASQEDFEEKRKDIILRLRKLNNNRIEKTMIYIESLKTYHSHLLKENLFPIKQSKLYSEINQLENDNRFLFNIKKKREITYKIKELEKTVIETKTIYENERKETKRIMEGAKTKKELYMKNNNLTNKELDDMLSELPNEKNLIDTAILREETNRDSIYHDPNVIKQYEERKLLIQSKEEKLLEIKNEFENFMNKIEEIKKKYLSHLEKILDEININFKQNCKNIGIFFYF